LANSAQTCREFAKPAPILPALSSPIEVQSEDEDGIFDDDLSDIEQI
jgi:hypothetical protein